MIQEVTPGCLAPIADLLNTTWPLPSQNFLPWFSHFQIEYHFCWSSFDSTFCMLLHMLLKQKSLWNRGGNISVPSLRVWFLLTAGSDALVSPCLRSGIRKRMLSSDGWLLLIHSGPQLVQRCCPHSGLVFSSHRPALSFAYYCFIV